MPGITLESFYERSKKSFAAGSAGVVAYHGGEGTAAGSAGVFDEVDADVWRYIEF